MALDYFDTAMGFAAVMLMLSLLVTVLVQMVVAVLGLRGANLAWGVKKLLEQVDPSLGQQAKTVAAAVLEHPTVKPYFRKATAISPAELVMILEDLVANPGRHQLDLSKSASFTAIVRKAAPGVSAQQASQAVQVVDEFSKLFPQHVEAVKGAAKRALQTKSDFEARVVQWFDTVMNRTTERFIVQTRIATILLGFGVAFSLNVDSIHILRQLSESKELRATFVAYADATLKQAEEAQKVVANSVVAAKVIAELAAGVKDPQQAAALKTVPASVLSLEQGRVWLEANFPDNAKRAELILAYSDGYRKTSVEQVKELGMTADKLHKSLDERLLKLTPVNRTWTLQNIVGLVITALFLSLGAPFWFNALRNLSNLRPVIAARVEGKSGA